MYIFINIYKYFHCNEWVGFPLTFPDLKFLDHPTSQLPKLQRPLGVLPFWRSLAPSTVTVSCCTSWVSNFHWYVVSHLQKNEVSLTYIHIHAYILWHHHTSLLLKQNEIRINRAKIKVKTFGVSLNPSSNRNSKRSTSTATPAGREGRVREGLDPPLRWSEMGNWTCNPLSKNQGESSRWCNFQKLI